MDSLAQWANVAEIFSAVTVVFGVAFGAIQLLHYRRQRQDLAAIELVKTLQSPAFTTAMQRVLELPAKCTTGDINSQGRSMDEAAMNVATTLEAVGLMVYQRLLSLNTARDLMGGLVVGSWQRLECWINTRRQELGRDEFAEWFQWFAERLIELCERDGRDPAYLRERDWKLPRS